MDSQVYSYFLNNAGSSASLLMIKSGFIFSSGGFSDSGFSQQTSNPAFFAPITSLT
jgi:hypothetical protein